MSTFNIAIDRILDTEGGYVNNPSDPGGETKFGISKRAYPLEDIKNLTREEAIALYMRDYWYAIRGGDLSKVMAFQVLDAAINHGITRAISWLQLAAGVTNDGKFGPKTLAVVGMRNQLELAVLFNSERLTFYASLNSFTTFGRGWIRRVANNLVYAVEDSQ